ncbi:hypothetical protein WS68_20875 [Burkholderia sp. TSV86]|nr:hypothetical protein WS68_20875 [Burkholderia sp. TSV86]
MCFMTAEVSVGTDIVRCLACVRMRANGVPPYFFRQAPAGRTAAATAAGAAIPIVTQAMPQ